jgi:hypothetical protein
MMKTDDRPTPRMTGAASANATTETWVVRRMKEVERGAKEIKAWDDYVRTHAHPGESFEAARARLRPRWEEERRPAEESNVHPLREGIETQPRVQQGPHVKPADPRNRSLGGTMGAVGPTPTKSAPPPSRKATEFEIQDSPLLLPYWSPAFRGVPNCMLRSALFGAIRRGPRRDMENELIPSLSNLVIRYTGKRLDQADLDVYLGTLQFAQVQGVPLGRPIYCKDREFLRAIGRNTGKTDRNWLNEARTRLKANQVEILVSSTKGYGGSLIQNWYRDDEREMTAIVLDPLLVALFDPGDWTSLMWEQRLALKSHPVAQWIHAFYSTHDEPYPYTVKKLHELCGSTDKNLFSYRQGLKGDLVLVQNTTGWICAIDKKDRVIVEKPSCSSGTDN